jgi:CRP-like cAMP-binding protein
MRLGFGTSGITGQKAQNKVGGISHKLANLNTADYTVDSFNQRKGASKEIFEMTGLIPLFDKIDSVHVGAIATHMKIIHLDEQQQLFAEGEKSDYMCFVVSGTLEVFKQSQNGEKVSVSTLSRGRCIGEMALIDTFPRSATVIARTPCTLLTITRNSFDQILEERPRAGVSLMKSLSRVLSLHLRKASGQLADACESTASVSPVPVLKEVKKQIPLPVLLQATALFANETSRLPAKGL